MIAAYLSLTKPRLVLGNIIVPAAAFIFGSPAAISWGGFCVMIVGLWLVMASGCVFNNYFDRGIDACMERTKNRALVVGTVNPTAALVWGAMLLIVGAFLLAQINMLTVQAGLVGWVAYALLYTPLKHRSGYALFVGAIAGAMPPVVGYVAASGQLDLNAGILFALMYLWQLPHFVAIALFRFDEYASAGVPLLVGRPKHERTRRRARSAFRASLAVLLLFCAALLAVHFSALH